MEKLIVTYDPLWANYFTQLETILKTALSGIDITIEHVGSTSIPGLSAKPILDIDIILQTPEDLDCVTSSLQELGYQARGEQGITGRFAFRPTDATVPHTPIDRNWPAHHLYVCFANAPALKNHLLFKKALLADPGLVERYERLKQALINEQQRTRTEYNQLKTAFILEVLKSQGMKEEELEEIRRANE